MAVNVAILEKKIYSMDCGNYEKSVVAATMACAGQVKFNVKNCRAPGGWLSSVANSISTD